eukprot:8763469-Lingulodinium_polyedra.AAC.1
MPSARVDIRLASPRAGHEQYWVVWTRGELAPGRAEEQLARHFSTVVRAREIVAYHPGRGLDEEAVLARAPPALGPSVTQAVAQGLVVR